MTIGGAINSHTGCRVVLIRCQSIIIDGKRYIISVYSLIIYQTFVIDDTDMTITSSADVAEISGLGAVCDSPRTVSVSCGFWFVLTVFCCAMNRRSNTIRRITIIIAVAERAARAQPSYDTTISDSCRIVTV